ncbi:MAG TPA: LURP-one-related family protein [Actinomycetota bacterium]|nr:LURP-one-related family protein [Actinomycetota bacterium]
MFGRKDSPDGTRFQLKEKLWSIGDDSWILDEHGERIFKVNGKALRIRRTLVIEPRDGGELYKIQERKLRIKDTMVIETPDGATAATVKEKLISPIRHRLEAELADGTELEITGNILDHEYEIKNGKQEVATVSKKWIRVRDTYGIEIMPGHDQALILAIAVCLDSMVGDD